MRSIKTEENGFASLVVALILILVLSLLTVGFAQVARREQQDALDSQLANQAYYAAETGVNDVKAELPALIAAATAGGANPATNPQFNGTSCLNSTYLPHNMNIVSSTDDVSYTCAIVRVEQPILSIPSTTNTGSGNYIFSTSTALNQMTFSWGSDNKPLDNSPAPAACPAIGCFSPATTWKGDRYPPVVQISITPLGTATFTRADLIADTYTATLYPDNGGIYPSTSGAVTDPDAPSGCTAGAGTVNYEPDNGYPDDSSCNALVIGANYNNAAGLACPYSVTFNLAAASPTPYDAWLVHYVYMYGGMNSWIQAGPPVPTVSGGNPTPCVYTNDTSSTTQDFVGSQVEVDVTGKAKDVEKRVVEYLPYPKGVIGSTATQNGLATLPYYAIGSGDTCKEFTTNPETPGPGPGVLTPESTVYNAAGTSAACTLGP